MLQQIARRAVSHERKAVDNGCASNAAASAAQQQQHLDMFLKATAMYAAESCTLCS